MVYPRLNNQLAWAVHNDNRVVVLGRDSKNKLITIMPSS
jgi:hypothetical protein